MLDLINKTDYKVAWNLACDPHGREHVCVVVKAAFTIPDFDGEPEPAPEPVSILFCDEYASDPERLCLRYPADLVPQKYGTDVGVIGFAHSAAGKPVDHLTAAVQVGPLKKTIRVFGERFWEKRALFGLRPSAPEPFTRMPLGFENAYGGEDQGQAYPSNPVGKGFVLNKKKAAGRPLPNLEDPAGLIQSPKDRPEPTGLGFIAPFWPQREQYAGTRDEKWQQEHFPLLPKDFDPLFYNAAAPGLVAEGFLKGGEPVRLTHLSPVGRISFDLPTIELLVTVRIGQTPHYRLADLWTIVFEPETQRFSMTWGATIAAGKQPGRIAYIKVAKT